MINPEKAAAIAGTDCPQALWDFAAGYWACVYCREMTSTDKFYSLGYSVAYAMDAQPEVESGPSDYESVTHGV